MQQQQLLVSRRRRRRQQPQRRQPQRRLPHNPLHQPRRLHAQRRWLPGRNAAATDGPDQRAASPGITAIISQFGTTSALQVRRVGNQRPTPRRQHRRRKQQAHQQRQRRRKRRRQPTMATAAAAPTSNSALHTPSSLQSTPSQRTGPAATPRKVPREAASRPATFSASIAMPSTRANCRACSRSLDTAAKSSF